MLGRVYPNIQTALYPPHLAFSTFPIRPYTKLTPCLATAKHCTRNVKLPADCEASGRGAVSGQTGTGILIDGTCSETPR